MIRMTDRRDQSNKDHKMYTYYYVLYVHMNIELFIMHAVIQRNIIYKYLLAYNLQSHNKNGPQRRMLV